MISKIKIIFGGASLLLLISFSIRVQWLSDQLKNVLFEKQAILAELTQSQNELNNIKEQYLQAQKVIHYVATQKQEIGERTIALQDVLSTLQKDSPCSNKLIPELVIKQLRERAGKVNSTITDSGNIADPLPGS